MYSVGKLPNSPVGVSDEQRFSFSPHLNLLPGDAVNPVRAPFFYEKPRVHRAERSTVCSVRAN